MGRADGNNLSMFSSAASSSSSREPAHNRNAARPYRSALVVATVVLLLGLGLTALVTWLAQVGARAASREQFTRLADQATAEIARRGGLASYGLAALRGFYAGSSSVERLEFRAFVASQDLAGEFPGVLGLGFIERVAPQELDAFASHERADHAPDFAVSTAGTRSDLYVLKFIEPLECNRLLWGADLGVDPACREAIEHAIASGCLTLSRRTTFTVDSRPEAGFLYVLPVYQKGTDPQTPAQRRQNLAGLVCAPALADGVFAGVAQSVQQRIDIDLFDGENPDEAQRLLESMALENEQAHWHGRMFKRSTPVVVGDRPWTLLLSSAPAFEAESRTGLPLLLGASGVLLSIMLSLLYWALATRRARAQTLANAMTADLSQAKFEAEAALREFEALRHTIDEHASVAVTDVAGNITDVNERFCHVSGYSRAELVGGNPRVVNSRHHSAAFWADVWQTIRAGKVWRGEVCNAAKNGTYYWVDSIIAPFADAAGRIEKYVTIQHDITERKRAEEALRQGESRFRTLVASIPGAVFRSEALPPWRVLFCSEGATAISGYAPSAFERGERSYSDLVHPDDLECLQESIAGAVARGQPYAVEHRMRCADSVPRWVHVRGQATYDDGGTPLWIDCVVLDVTERKRAEEALQQSAEKVRAIVENVGIGVAMISPEMRVLELNRQMREWFPNIETQHGPRCYESFNNPPRTAVCEYCPTQKTLQDGLVHEAVTHTPTDDGFRDYRVVASPVRDANGRVVAAIEMVEDVTARYRAERALAEASRLRIEINDLQQVLLGPGELDEKLQLVTDGVVRLFEADFCRIWVTRPGDLCETCVHAQVEDELIGCPAQDACLHLVASSGRYSHVNGTRRRIPFDRCKIGRLATGSERRVLSNDIAADKLVYDQAWARELGLVSFAGYQLRPHGDDTVGVLALFSKHAITPEVDGLLASLANAATQVIQAADAHHSQRVLESQLAQSQRLESVGQLAAGIAHEINTPTQFVSDNARFLRNAFPKLTDLLGQYQALADACRKNTASADMLSVLEEAVRAAKLDYLLEQIPEALSDSLEGLERVTKIVRAMKDFAHPGQESAAPADLNKAIESTITVARNEWKYVADLELDLDPALPPVPCLLGDFNQVILNIVVNAAHAIKDVVGDAGQGKGTITISTRCVADQAEIRIRDTGTGIPEQHRARVFDHFFTTKEVGKGTGQGLSLARRVIVDKHGGTLTFETETGRGTTFIIRLPIQGAPEVAAT